MERGGEENRVLCTYFFQAMVADEDAPAEDYSSSLLLSSQPTLEELRRKFPFEGTFHFRLQVATKDGSYCWLDLTDPARTLPVGRRNAIYIKALQLSVDAPKNTDGEYTADQIDVPEDHLLDAFFRSQDGGKSGRPADDGSGYSAPQDVGAVLSGVKKALASKMKQSGLGESLQKKLDKVLGSSTSAPPTAASLGHLAKLVGAMKTPLSDGNHEHVELLNRLWVTCFDLQPFVLSGGSWGQLGFRSKEPMRELQYVLPLQCLVFFHEVHRQLALPILNDQASPGNPDTYSYGGIASRLIYVLSEILQLKDGACLGLERPFWRLFEDPIAFFELFAIMFRAFDESWKMKTNKSNDVGVHLDYAAEFARELLRRGPDSVATLVGSAHQLQKW